MLSTGSRMFRIPIRIFFLIYSIAIPVRIIDVDLPAAIFHNIFFLTKKKQISLDFHRKNIFVQKKYRFSDRQIYLSRKQSSSSFSSCSTTPETPQVIFLPPEVQISILAFNIRNLLIIFTITITITIIMSTTIRDATLPVLFGRVVLPLQ